MKIALVSYEYAGGQQGGGIGTYIRNAAHMLANRGHNVEVFTGPDADADGSQRFKVHSVTCARSSFAKAVLDPFLQRHRRQPFDVVEGPEYGADLAFVAEAVPSLAKVVKLHTASYQITRINEAYLTARSKIQFIAGAIRRGHAPKPYWGRYDPGADPERTTALLADEITSPSRALLLMTGADWELPSEFTAVIPNPFFCPLPLLQLNPARRRANVTFLGRLEVRKGVIELARAIPLVLRAFPEVQFRFVGRSLPHPDNGAPMHRLIRELSGARSAANVEIQEAVPYAEVPNILSDAAIAVFPSYWEAYGYVCLEAMAAGCAVVGSSAGGMSEIIDHGRTGVLVPPRNPRAIADAIISLLRDSERRIAMGAAARAHVLAAYSADVIAPLQEASYARAIARAKARSLELHSGAQQS